MSIPASKTPYVSNVTQIAEVNLGSSVPLRLVQNGTPGNLSQTQPNPVSSSAKPAFLVGGGKITYKGRSYVVRVGTRGGKYISVKGKKVYL